MGVRRDDTANADACFDALITWAVDPSAGILGPELFNLPLDASIGVIVGFNVLACLPVAYL